MKGYQFLQNSFFELCETRKIRRIPMLLYIYLRGLYCRFQKPNFFWHDKTIKKHLGISTNTLSAAKSYLQERGLIKYTSGIGRTPTQYTMLGAVLLPELRVSKSDTLSVRSKLCESIKKRHSIYTSKEREKKKIGIFQGITDSDRDFLRSKGVYK
ncbi:MAG: hypothetical protein JSV93_02690 [Candidatus Omnitrophota bacterium]|nr:MAG: hypothetical protein JSV93_02690 [Candidatus Omnitrophota bacterium]